MIQRGVSVINTKLKPFYMKRMYALSLLFSVLGLTLCLFETNAQEPPLSDWIVFEEIDGILSVEAEYFYKQTHDEQRKWYVTHKENLPNVGRDEDTPHIFESSNNAYLEVLPDTRITHDDKLIPGENFSNEPGKMAILYYKVAIEHPGRYYVWVRAFSAGGEDNGIHVGLDGTWPDSGQRMQWCEGKHKWHWESKQRTEAVHCGEPWKIYLDIETPGEHEIMFSLREDGFEFDKFILTKGTTFVPEGPGPRVTISNGKLPTAFEKVSENFKFNQN